MKRIILSILSVFITLGAAAETGQALPAVQRAATAAVEETPSGNEDTVPPETSDAFAQHLAELGYPHVEETANPAYRAFL